MNMIRTLCLTLIFSTFAACNHASQNQSKVQANQATPAIETPKTESPVPKSGPQPVAEATPFVITPATHWKTVEEFDYSLPPNQIPVHFKLERPEHYSDPGDFIRIRIQVQGQPEFIVDNQDGWVEYNDPEQNSEVYAQLGHQNLAKSGYVLLLPGTMGRSGPPLVLLRSWVYASNAERLHVIGFRPSGKPILLLNTELDLEQLVDLDGDGVPEIVGWPCLSQEWGPGLQTYDPLHVYKIPHPITAPARLSLGLSKAYNLKHYYGWAGPECSEDLAIVMHPPSGGKPLIMKAKEAEDLMAGEHKKKHN